MEIIPLPRPRAVSGSCDGQFDILISPVILLGYVVLSKNSATYVPPEFLFFLELLMMTHHCFVCLELSAVAKSLFLPGAVPVPSTPSVHTLLYLPPVKSERLLVRVGCKRTRIFTHTLRRCPHGLREAWESHETIGLGCPFSHEILRLLSSFSQAMWTKPFTTCFLDEWVFFTIVPSDM